jgi:FtsP/CotA-like multicopper oxidase with cupredoxin domain
MLGAYGRNRVAGTRAAGVIRGLLAMTQVFARQAFRIIAVSVAGIVALCGAANPGFDIPTGAAASPLYGAEPFTQKMLRFEEFGLQPMPTEECATCIIMPPAPSCDGIPSGNQMDFFLRQTLAPLPTYEANTSRQSAWHNRVSACIAPLSTSAAEGRAPGHWFAHQRWNEFYPEVFFQTAQTGARRNNGLRDPWQRHHWTVGEWRPNGLYHQPNGNRNIDIRFHPNMPIQTSQKLWTFDGTLPPKLLQARYGEPILFRHYNALPVNPAANGGFGANTITTHEHNGHNPAESDGYTAAYFFPGQFYDYHWPMVLAGHDSINTGATTDWAGAPDGAGGVSRVRGDWRETMSTHWFHDHMLDYTAQNVYKGNAAMMNYYSSIDRGRERYRCNYTNDDYPNMCFPSGWWLDWGNRDYDVNLLIADKAWDAQGQLFFNIFNRDGFLGDRVMVNWLWKPYMQVKQRRYRFRVLNGAVSRYFKIAVVERNSGQRVPFHMIANDGNIMEHAVPFPNAESADLPAQGIAERYDIIIDFSRFAPGTRIQLVNLMEHKKGRGPERIVPLEEALNPTYDGDPAVGPFMEFRVLRGGVDFSMNPAEYEEGGRTMIPRPVHTQADIDNARVRTFTFGRSGNTDEEPWSIKVDGGDAHLMDPHRVMAAPTIGQWEIWRLQSGGDWSHPVHIHFEEGVVLSRDGAPPPIWERWARKDLYRVGGEIPSAAAAVQESVSVDVLIRFREFVGSYMEHCHNTQHEDHSMLMRWDNENPGQTQYIPTPVPTWEGVYYEDSYGLPNVRGSGPSASAGPGPNG